MNTPIEPTPPLSEGKLVGFLRTATGVIPVVIVTLHPQILESVISQVANDE